ncbi:hypothetical protein [Timonella senegalensis]|uniref:hypothetical protein n=1 Tax=Timonella senegalensis TaxID=1465825 RepID=UPI00030E64E2|nr:hypothetical protein [Timonella senegalensis]
MAAPEPHESTKRSASTLQERLQAKLDAAPSQDMAGSTGKGFGRILVTVYAILAIAATARGTWQLLDHGSDAPLAYGLSLLAGVIYLVATFALAKGGNVWRKVAWGAVLFEAIGVLAVGISSIFEAGWFPDKSVWSNFGQGYGYIPLVLPFVGVYWLWRTRPSALN